MLALAQAIEEVEDPGGERRLKAVDLQARLGPRQVSQVHREFVIIGFAALREKRHPLHRTRGNRMLTAPCVRNTSSSLLPHGLSALEGTGCGHRVLRKAGSSAEALTPVQTSGWKDVPT